MEFNSSTRQNGKKRPLDDDSSKELSNKETKIEITPFNPMLFYPVFPHITEKIFNHLEKRSVKDCREVSKSWLDSIDN